MLTTNKIIKFSYHLFTAIFLYNLTKLNNIPEKSKYILYIICMFHLYDTYWFYKYDKNAPI